MGLEVLFLLPALLVLAGPILAVIALIRLGALDRATRARLERLERAVDALRRGTAEAPLAPAPPGQAAPARPPGEAPASPATKPLRPPAAARPRSGPDLESLIAGRWLNRIGIVALLLAAGFFLKFAFDNDWIGTRGRVAVGLLAGAGLMVWGQTLLGRGYRYFSEGITGLGGGVLYLSIYAAYNFYRLVPVPVAFSGMVAVTAVLALLAWVRNSERVALLALIGGLLTPGLLSTGQDAQVLLFSYLALLVAGVVVLVRLREWRTLEPLALAGTVAYLLAWYLRFYDPSKRTTTLFFASLLFLELALPAALRAWRGVRLRGEQVAWALVNAGWFVVALHLLLYRDMRWALTFAVLVLAALYLAAAARVRTEAEPSLARLLFAGLALTLVTIAIPIRLEGRWIIMAWAVEGAILVWSGLRADRRLLRLAGLALLAATVVLLAMQPMTAPRALFNARFGTFATTVAAFAASSLLARGQRARLGQLERRIFDGVGLCLHPLALWALSLEVWDFAGRLGFGADRALAQQLGLSLLWTIYSAGLIFSGVRWRSALLRWQGLALIGVVVAKVFLHDLSFLERGFRILSFVAVGVLLLVISFLYQRRTTTGEAAGRG